MKLLDYFFFKLNSVNYDPLSLGEELQLKLDIVHAHTEREETIYMADIRANIKMRWDATLEFIDRVKLNAELRNKEEKAKREQEIVIVPEKKKRTRKKPVLVEA